MQRVYSFGAYSTMLLGMVATLSSIEARAVTNHVAVDAGGADLSSPSWNVMVAIQLHKQGKHSTNCPSYILSDLENEFRDWVQEELELVTGDDTFDMPNVAANEYDNGRRTEVQVVVRGIRNPMLTTTSIERPLQWTVQTIVDRWRSDIRYTKMDSSCMGKESSILRASLDVKAVPYVPSSWKTTPIIVGFSPMTNSTTSEEESSVVIGVY